MLSTKSTTSTCWCEYWKIKDERMWVCSHVTWNFLQLLSMSWFKAYGKACVNHVLERLLNGWKKNVNDDMTFNFNHHSHWQLELQNMYCNWTCALVHILSTFSWIPTTIGLDREETPIIRTSSLILHEHVGWDGWLQGVHLFRIRK